MTRFEIGRERHVHAGLISVGVLATMLGTGCGGGSGHSAHGGNGGGAGAGGAGGTGVAGASGGSSPGAAGSGGSAAGTAGASGAAGSAAGGASGSGSGGSSAGAGGSSAGGSGGAGGGGGRGGMSGTGGASATGGRGGTGGTGTGGTGTGGTGTGGTGTGGTGTGGTSTGTGGAAGASGCVSTIGAASVNADGVLTNYPAIRFTKTNGDIQITSAYFALQTTTSFSSVQVWGDLKNNGTQQQCIPLSDSFNIGTQSVLVVAEGNPYKSGVLTLTEVCIEAGGKAAYRGIQNSVSPTLLTTATSVSYEFSGLVLSPSDVPEPYDPALLSAAPTQVSLGWALAGQMHSSAMTIYNMEVTVYVRDTNGLLYDDIDAFPYDLNDVPPSTTFDFATYSTPNKFCAYERYDSFIEGSMTTQAFAASQGPVGARLDTYAARKATLRSLRGQLAR